jgi:hypothetical protein
MAAVAEVASSIFGTAVSPDAVIGETLMQVMHGSLTRESLRKRLSERPNYATDYASFIADPLATWVEQRLGLDVDEDRRAVRAKPRNLNEAASMLSEDSGAELNTCQQHLQAVLLAGFATANPDTGLPVFAFRLHQFISRGDTVYASVEKADDRYMTLNAQQYVPEIPGDRSRILLPLAFCRECGQEYYVVDWDQKDQQLSDRRRSSSFTLHDGELKARHVSSRSDPEDNSVISGYVALADDLDWTGDPEDFPEDWLEIGPDGFPRLQRSYRAIAPVQVTVASDGKCSPGGALKGINAWFLFTPFRVCIRCGVSYSGRQRSDIGKLTELATEGRSTATTVLSLSIVQALREASDISRTARKLLSFTDNRQDASL